MTITERDRLRTLLGEVIPVGGVDTDTLLTDETLDDLLSRHATVEASLAEAWQIKAAALANMVDIVEGDSKESLSQLHKQALAMMEHFTTTGGGVGVPTTQVHKIVRPGGFQG